MYVLLVAVIIAASLLFGGMVNNFGPDRPKPTPKPKAAASGSGYCISKEYIDEVLEGPADFSCNDKTYVLVAENVMIPKIFIHPEKQLKPRATCEGVQYYSWLCHPFNNGGSLWNNTLWKAVPDENKPPADGDLFNIYMQRDPDEWSAFFCGQTGIPPGGTSGTTRAEDIPPSTIGVEGIQGALVFTGRAFSIDIEPAPSRKKISTIKIKNADGDEVEYDVWENLLRAFAPDKDSAIYIVPKGILTEAVIPDEVPYSKYFITLVPIGDTGKQSLQLQTFRVLEPPDNPWWNIYLPESKPVVYLYPESTAKISVKVKPTQGKITVSDPLYPEGGWDVISDPASNIAYKNTTYPYLYYETEVAGYKIPEEGFVFEKKNIAKELRSLVEKLGLRGVEADDFVSYWVDRFERDIKTDSIFVGVITEEEMDRVVPLEITPKPTTVIRVRLYFEEADGKIKPIAPKLPITKARQGFTVVEWGGILDN